MYDPDNKEAKEKIEEFKQIIETLKNHEKAINDLKGAIENDNAGDFIGIINQNSFNINKIRLYDNNENDENFQNNILRSQFKNKDLLFFRLVEESRNKFLDELEGYGFYITDFFKNQDEECQKDLLKTAIKGNNASTALKLLKIKNIKLKVVDPHGELPSNNAKKVVSTYNKLQSQKAKIKIGYAVFFAITFASIISAAVLYKAKDLDIKNKATTALIALVAIFCVATLFTLTAFVALNKHTEKKLDAIVNNTEQTNITDKSKKFFKETLTNTKLFVRSNIDPLKEKLKTQATKEKEAEEKQIQNDVGRISEDILDIGYDVFKYQSQNEINNKEDSKENSRLNSRLDNLLESLKNL